jgi:hypothetical protein
MAEDKASRSDARRAPQHEQRDAGTVAAIVSAGASVVSAAAAVANARKPKNKVTLTSDA